MRNTLSILLLLICYTAFAEQAEFDPFPQNRGTIYDHGDDIPEVCFFPLEKAKWNGYEIKASNWRQLTDYQKVMFVTEGAEEIERRKGIKIDIEDEFRYVVAINGAVASLPEDSNILVFRFLYELLTNPKGA